MALKRACGIRGNKNLKDASFSASSSSSSFSFSGKSFRERDKRLSPDIPGNYSIESDRVAGTFEVSRERRRGKAQEFWIVRIEVVAREKRDSREEFVSFRSRNSLRQTDIGTILW